MRNRAKFCAFAAVLVSGIACSSGRHSASAFHLPGDGDGTRGRAAFLDLGCNQCHTVAGDNLPKPDGQLQISVPLGGEINKAVTDAYLVTSMLDPSYRLTGYRPSRNETSRMPHYADLLTARQMIDLTAYLQAHYTVLKVRPDYTYR